MEREKRDFAKPVYQYTSNQATDKHPTGNFTSQCRGQLTPREEAHRSVAMPPPHSTSATTPSLIPLNSNHLVEKECGYPGRRAFTIAPVSYLIHTSKRPSFTQRAPPPCKHIRHSSQPPDQPLPTRRARSRMQAASERRASRFQSSSSTHIPERCRTFHNLQNSEHHPSGTAP